MEGLLAIILAGFVMYILASVQYSSARSSLEKWAAENGYEILDRSLSYSRYPKKDFVPKASRRHDVIYYVSLLDRNHRRKNAWVRCRQTLLDTRLDVIWDDWPT